MARDTSGTQWRPHVGPYETASTAQKEMQTKEHRGGAGASVTSSNPHRCPHPGVQGGEDMPGGRKEGAGCVVRSLTPRSPHTSPKAAGSSITCQVADGSTKYHPSLQHL